MPAFGCLTVLFEVDQRGMVFHKYDISVLPSEELASFLPAAIFWTVFNEL